MDEKRDGASQLTFALDRAERLTEVREAAGSQRVLKTFAYASANGSFTDPGTGATCTENKKGKLTQQSRFNYVTIFGSPYTVEMREGMTYCGRDGRLSRESLENRVNGATTPNESFVLPNLSYDALGNLTSESYPQCTHAACTAPSPRTVTNGYSSGFLTAVGFPGSTGAYASSITYHPNGMVNQVVHANTPSIPSTWLTDTYALDPFGMKRPASITTTSSGGAQRWATGAYGYDGAGNIKSMGTHTFGYDKVSRLTAANLYLEPTSSTTLRFQTFSYDAFGNIQSIGGSSARSTPTSSSTNRLTGTTMAYDAQGNVTAWNGNQYEYDPFNLMWHYKTATAGDEWIYLYTADDERVWSYKVDNTSLWTLREPGGSVLREYTTNGTWIVQSDYIYRDGALLAAETASGLRHFHLDHLGTPRLVTNSTGLQAAYHVYYPYGEEATAFNQDTIRAKFTGHERDLGNPGGSGDDLDYMHARFCSPIAGRFWSTDPAGGSAPRPQSWNLYLYVVGNPMNFVDPDGRQEAQLFYNIFGINVRPSDTVPFATATAADTLFFGGLGFRAALSMAAAEIGPQVLVVGAGALGYGAGTLINQIPGVSAAITSSLGLVIEPFVLAHDSGGGKTGRKTSKHMREEGQRLLDELRKALKEAKSKQNKEPKDHDVVDSIEKAIRKLKDRIRKSENHAGKAQGSN